MSLAAQNLPAFSTPLSSGAKPAAFTDRSNVSRAAWHREMERAMSDAWFRHPLLTDAFHQDAGGTSQGTDGGTRRGDGARAAAVRAGIDVGGATESTAARSAGDGASDYRRASGSAARLQEDSRARSGEAGPDGGSTPSSDLDGRAMGAASSAGLIALSSLVPAGAADGMTPRIERIAEPGNLTHAARLARPVEPVAAGLRSWGDCVEADSPSHAASEEELARSGSREASASREPLPPLRMHAEWTDEGVRLWLGADAASDVNPPQLMQQMMQWLGEQRVRLLSLVLNGRTVYRAPSDAAVARNFAGSDFETRLHQQEK